MEICVRIVVGHQLQRGWWISGIVQITVRLNCCCSIMLAISTGSEFFIVWRKVVVSVCMVLVPYYIHAHTRKRFSVLCGLFCLHYNIIVTWKTIYEHILSWFKQLHNRPCTYRARKWGYCIWGQGSNFSPGYEIGLCFVFGCNNWTVPK